jgi:hypothetical protein
MAFGMGIGELLLILLIVMAVVTALGSMKRTPQLEELLRRWLAGLDPTRPRLVARRPTQRWSTIDWLLVSTTAALAVTLAVSYAYGR